MGEIRKVRVGDIGRELLNTYRDEVYNGIKPIHKNKFDEFQYNDDFHEYDWESLKQSILEDGYDINKYKPIRVHTEPSEFSVWAVFTGKYSKEPFETGKGEFKYYVIDGLHRVFILREMFGDDYMIDVDVHGAKKDTKKTNKSIIGYIESVNAFIPTGYFLIFHTIPIIVMMCSYYIINKYLPNIGLYLLITDFYGIVIVYSLTSLITYILSKFEKEEKGDK